MCIIYRPTGAFGFRGPQHSPPFHHLWQLWSPEISPEAVGAGSSIGNAFRSAFGHSSVKQLGCKAWLQSLAAKLGQLGCRRSPTSAGEAVCHGWCSCRPLLQGAWELVYCMKAKFLEHVFDGKMTDRWGTQRHLMKHMGVPFVSEGTPHIAAPFGKQWQISAKLFRT